MTVPPRLSIEVERTRRGVIVALEGVVDLATAPLLERTLVGAEASDAGQILVTWRP